MSEEGTTGARVLVVEDERAQREPIVQFLRARGYEVDGVGTGEEAQERIVPGRYAVVLSDLRLPGVDGLAVLRHARAVDVEAGLLLVTAYASVESAIEALRQGTHDYLLKPLILEDVARKVGHLVEHRRLVAENLRLRDLVHSVQQSPALVVESPAMQGVEEWIRRAAGAESSNVLIEGETGTGKEVVARRIHAHSPRAKEIFLPVNLAAVPENLAESELFGHERGAFTGAQRRRAGVLRAAGRGTVFLDEVAELSLPVQAKLLRVIEEREVRPVGSDHAQRFEARIIVATHRDLDARVREGSFREDLFYRLNVVRIRIPPLHERPEDIPHLARDLLARHAVKLRKHTSTIAPAAMAVLCAYPWRGNVRELSNVIERTLILADADCIEVEHLPPDVTGSKVGSLRLDEAVERFERAHISLILKLCDGNREATAKALGVSPATLYRRLEKLGLKGAPGLAAVRARELGRSQI